jgi:hypothetical protein
MQDNEDHSGKADDDVRHGASAAHAPNAKRTAEEMSDEEWLEALLELNPWARGSNPDHWNSDDFLALKGHEISRQLRRPISDWNIWASRVSQLWPLLPQARPIQKQWYDQLFSIEIHNLMSRTRRIDFRNRMLPHSAIARGEVSLELRFDGAHVHGDFLLNGTFSHLAGR